MLISYETFGHLRLSHFLPSEDLVDLDGWEFQDRIWVGEALGFSEWLRLESEPETLRSLAVNFADFPPPAAVAVLRAIDLPVERGMSKSRLTTVLGPHVVEKKLAAGRVTRVYLTSAPDPYRVSCTIRDDGGLAYLVVTVPLEGSGA